MKLIRKWVILYELEALMYICDMLKGFELRLSRSWQRMKAKINCQVIKQIT
mgnify:CR=1 FL=1